MANENVNIVIKAFDRTRGAFSTATRGIAGVARAAVGLRSALVAVAGAGGFAYMVKSSLDATDALAKTASRIGTTTEALSRLQYVGKLTGVETNTMSMALQRFTRRTAEAAKGTGEAQGALKELGIDATQITQLPLDQQMVVLADAFGRVQNEADKVRLAFKLFDSEGVALVNTLKLGSSGMNDLMAEAETLGIVMSQDAAKGVESANDSIFKLTSVARGLRDQFVAGLAPALESLSEALRTAAVDAAEARGGFDELGRDLAASFVDGTITSLRALQTLMNGVVGAYNTMLDVKAGFDKAFDVADPDNIAQLKNELADLQGLLESGNVLKRTVLFGDDGLIKVYSEEEIQQKIGEIQARIAELQAQGMTDGAIGLFNFEPLIAALGVAKEAIKSTTEEGKKLEEVLVTATAPTMWDSFKAAAQDAFTNVTNGMKSLTQLMEGFVNNSMNSVTNGFTDLITGAKSVKDAFKDMASSIINDLIRMLVQYYITQQMFNAITGFIGGGSPTGGAPAPGKAIGGSVQAGKAYMIGERGQELFIPNQSGSIVANDKLGSGGNVVVNQTINVSTGVQQTVRAEIQNLMPQIANSAKAAVADARMRGGSYSKALVGA